MASDNQCIFFQMLVLFFFWRRWGQEGAVNDVTNLVGDSSPTSRKQAILRIVPKELCFILFPLSASDFAVGKFELLMVWL